jgi:hypothetical protein
MAIITEFCFRGFTLPTGAAILAGLAGLGRRQRDSQHHTERFNANADLYAP